MLPCLGVPFFSTKQLSKYPTGAIFCKNKFVLLCCSFCWVLYFSNFACNCFISLSCVFCNVFSCLLILLISVLQALSWPASTLASSGVHIRKPSFLGLSQLLQGISKQRCIYF